MRYARVSARKVRDLADLIRGLTVGEARQQLMATHRPSAGTMVSNLLKSVTANAKDLEFEGDADDLVIGEIQIDAGPIIKRFRPMSMGRGGAIRKRTCHMTIHLYTEA
jgi:large subunit ribosomal protein L22